jgi:hypothetical protein
LLGSIRTNDNAQQWFDFLATINDDIMSDEGYHHEFIAEGWQAEATDSSYDADSAGRGFLESLLGALNQASYPVTPTPPIDSSDPDDPEPMYSFASGTNTTISADRYYDFLYAVMRENAQLATWHNIYLGDMHEDELYDAITDLEHTLSDYAIARVSTYEDLIGDESSHRTFRSKAKEDLTDQLHGLCQLMVDSHIPITINVFDILNVDYTIDDHRECEYRNTRGIAQYFPYGDQAILERLNDLDRLLGELHFKVDTLLSTEDRIGLSKFEDIKITPPDKNPYLLHKNSDDTA